MSWRCTPERLRGTLHRPPSPPNLPSCSGSWRSVWNRQRTCSASQDQKPSSSMSIAILCSNTPAYGCRAEPPTVWKILRQAGCIEEHRRRKPKPLELRQPGEEVQFDLKDASSVPADPAGKQQHVVEIANFVDAGTSIWLHREVRGDFDAEALWRAWWSNFCGSQACLRCSPLIPILASLEALQDAISLPRWCASCCVWG